MQQKKKDYFWNLVGTVLQSALSPVLLIVVTQLNGIEASGLFSFAVSISVVFWAVSLWGGRTYQVSDVDKEFTAGGYFAVRAITSVIVLLSAVMFCILSGYDSSKTNLILLLVSFKITESFADVMYGILQTHHRLYISGVSLMMKSVIGFGAFVAVNNLTGDLLLSSAALLLVNLIGMAFFDLPWVRRVGERPRRLLKLRPHLRESLMIMRRTAPVFVVIFLTMFSLNIPRYFLDKYHPDQIGYFGIMAMPITLLGLLVSFIIQPNIVELSNLYNQGKIKQFTRIVYRMLAATLLLGLVAVGATYAVGVEVLNIVFSIQLAPFKWELIVMVIGAVATALLSIYINILIVMRRFKGACLNLFFTNLVLLLCSPMIIEPQAMMGAVGLFTGISIIQVGLLAYLYTRHTHKRKKMV